MRIRRLDLAAFGPFTEQSLDFGDGGGLWLVLGPNEAGKSSALRGLTQFLYGMPHRFDDNFIHANKDIEIRGLLRFADGQELELARHKKLKNDLVRLPGKEPMDQERLSSLMGGLGGDVFSRLFGIDFRELSDRSEDMLQAGGALGESLFAASGGIRGLREVRERLDKEAKGLFTHRGGVNMRINSAMNDLKALRREQKELATTPSAWKTLRRSVRKLEKQRADLQARLDELNREASRLERYRQAQGPARSRVELLAELDALGEAASLPPDFTERRSAAMVGLESARRDAEDFEADLAALDARIAEIGPDNGLAHSAGLVEGLYSVAATHAKALSDARNLASRNEHLTAQAEELLRGLRPDLDLENVDELRLSRQDHGRIRSLADRHRELAGEKRGVDRDRAVLDQELAEARRSLDALSVPASVDDLADAVERVAGRGDMQARLGALQAECNAQRSAVEAAVEALGLWSGTPEELAALPVPSDETIRRFEIREADHAAALRAAEDRKRQAAALHGEKQAASEALRAGGEVPSESDLAAARDQRDGGWELVRRRLDGTTDEEGERVFLEEAGGDDLSVAFDATMRKADAVADTLRNEAERVAENAALDIEMRRLEREVADASQTLEAVRARGDELRGEWIALWQPCSITPLPAREMRNWAERHKAVLRRLDDLRAKEAEGAALETASHDFCAELSRQLEKAGQSVSPESSLAALFDRARRTVKEARSARDARTAAIGRVRDLERRLADADARIAHLTNEHAAWRKSWAPAVQPLGLSDAAAPEEARALLDDVTDLFRIVTELRDKQNRVAAIQGDYNAYSAEVRTAVDKLAPDLADTEPVRAARELHDRLTSALARKQERSMLKARRTDAADKLAAAQRRRRDLEQTLSLLCGEAGCEAPEGLEEAERRARRLAEVKSKLVQAEQVLAAAAGGTDLDTFAAEALAKDTDSMAATLKRVHGEADALRAEREEVLQDLGGAKSSLEAMDGTSRAAEQAERAQGVIGQIQSDTDRFIRLKLASLVVAREIERYRRDNQAPVLKRASREFATLTAGAFSGLDTDFDARGEPVLLGVRADDTRIGVSAMSDGTRDQLFLALRLAGLHRYLDNNPPVPFIVDDILIHFDDRRAEATLKALAALAERTQVVFFTHHDHLLPLAQRAVPKKTLGVLRLNGKE